MSQSTRSLPSPPPSTSFRLRHSSEVGPRRRAGRYRGDRARRYRRCATPEVQAGLSEARGFTEKGLADSTSSDVAAILVPNEGCVNLEELVRVVHSLAPGLGITMLLHKLLGAGPIVDAIGDTHGASMRPSPSNVVATPDCGAPPSVPSAKQPTRGQPATAAKEDNTGTETKTNICTQFDAQ